MFAKIGNILTHNPVSSKIRQLLCGWHAVKRRGVTIWYQKVKIYPGYSEYDYDMMFERVIRKVKTLWKKYPGKRAVVKMDVFYSGGRPGVGTRKVSYLILPYGKVF